MTRKTSGISSHISEDDPRGQSLIIAETDEGLQNLILGHNFLGTSMAIGKEKKEKIKRGGETRKEKFRLERAGKRIRRERMRIEENR